MSSATAERCGYRWRLIDPADDDGAGAAHQCGRELGHFGPHRCPHDGEERDR
jgi:hypothetical protein